MLRKLLVGATSTALLLGGASVAVAAESAEPTCDEAKASLTKLEKKRDDKAAEERVAENAALDKAKKDRDAAEAEVDRLKAAVADAEKNHPRRTDAIETLKGQLRTAEDALVARNADVEKAKKDLAHDSNPLAGLRAQVELAMQVRDKACGDDKPAPTSPASPTPKPEDDIDCDEVSGPEAQRILDADRNDPNNLDIDNDGVACDVDEVPVPGDPAPADPGVVVNNNVAVPSGGVATGGGPAWAFE